jgi:hypothetical protein
MMSSESNLLFESFVTKLNPFESQMTKLANILLQQEV